MQEKTPLEISEMIKTNPILKVIDVREQWEYDKCHIDKSTHIPMGKIPDSIDMFDDAYEYVIVCHHGIRSRTVALYLEQKGVKNLYNLTGGIEQWSDDVDSNMEKYK
jgi:rhodanese-related sulfurtransferase